MGLFDFLFGLFDEKKRLGFDPSADVVGCRFEDPINQIFVLGGDAALKCVEIEDYIQWNEVFGVPNTPSFAGGRTVYGIVTGITESSFEVIGIGYYGRLGKNGLQPTHYTTKKQIQNAQSNDPFISWNGIDRIIKKCDIVWRNNTC